LLRPEAALKAKVEPEPISANRHRIAGTDLPATTA
jgi:hypothetical protein